MALGTLVRTLTTPLLPDDYAAYVNPLWSRREPRGIVDAVLPETADAATLWLRVPSGWPEHTAGQYVRVGVDIDGVRHWRTYSLTGGRDGRIAITVKATPDGYVSRKLVFATPRGTVVRLAPPAGEFVLPEPLPQRLLFVTAGSGVTPVMGMLRHLAARPGGIPDVLHVHLAPSRVDVIFGDELRHLARRHERYELREHHDDADGVFEVAGLPVDRAAFACGPAGLLDALEAHLPDMTVERFRPVVATVAGEGGTVTFTASRRTADADGGTPLLVAGEEAGALLPSGCRMGICHSCVGRLTAGAVRDLRTGDLIPAEDQMVRTCVSAAAGPCEIDL
jgi:stearoyl-CoA 9-desaturase NADPH oxidoreductase